MRRAAKVDRNQSEVVAALRAAGWVVRPTHRLGQGFPDLCASRRRVNLLVEVKMPGEGLTPDEKIFHDEWCGPLIVVYSGQDAVDKAHGWAA